MESDVKEKSERPVLLIHIKFLSFLSLLAYMSPEKWQPCSFYDKTEPWENKPTNLLDEIYLLTAEKGTYRKYFVFT